MNMRNMNPTKVINEVLNSLLDNPDCLDNPEMPIFHEGGKCWKVSGLRSMQVYVKTLESRKIPIKWAFKEIFGRYGITTKHLSSSQIENMFHELGFKTGSYGRGD